MNTYTLNIKPFGQHAILVEWPKEVSVDILEDIMAFTAFLKKECLDPKIWEFVPAYNSLALIDNSGEVGVNKVMDQMPEWYAARPPQTNTQRNLWKIPVCYEDPYALDKGVVSDYLGMSFDEVIAAHTQSVYTVFGIGFLPGFMYLGGLPPNLEIPRRDSPRPKVPQGSVGLASKQTGIYPQESPGGWNIIGNSPVFLFDPRRKTPSFVKAGDKVQFYAIAHAEYELHKIESEVGIYKLEKETWDA